MVVLYLYILKKRRIEKEKSTNGQLNIAYISRVAVRTEIKSSMGCVCALGVRRSGGWYIFQQSR